MKAAWIGKAATDNTLQVSSSRSVSRIYENICFECLTCACGSRKGGLSSTAATFVPAMSAAEKKAMQARNRAYETNVEVQLWCQLRVVLLLMSFWFVLL